MSSLSRFLCPIALAAALVSAPAAEAPKDTPFGQAGSTTPASGGVDTLEFSGVSTVGKKTMINLYDKQDKRSFWVEAGTTSAGVTVVKYDNAHDQVTVRRNGTEKLLPLRPPSAVVNGSVAAVPVPTPALSAPAPTGTTAPAAPLSQARQEEEARMLVSDLLEIGMAQRRAYEEAQRKAAGGSAQPSAAPAAEQNATTTPVAAAPQPATAAQTATTQPGAAPAN